MGPFTLKKPEPRKLYIPEANIEEVLEAWDKYQDHWKHPSEILPEVQVGNWYPKFRESPPYLIERLPE